jgi:hypothetical protein
MAILKGMNDPHIVSLIYRIEKAQTVDFDKAPPRSIDCGAFRITLDAYKAKVEMFDHFALAEQAREVVDPFLRAWKLSVDLGESGDRFKFVYERPEVIDRNPAGKPNFLYGVVKFNVVEKPVVHVSRDKWPDPPQELKVSPDADVLWRRWWRHREQEQEPLLSAAYWALTMLEAAPGLAAPAKPRPSSKRRQAASAFFNIDLDVLNMIGKLTSTRGGNDEERKAEGRATPLSPAERQWLEATFRVLVRRVAEQAHPGGPPPKPLAMSDLPSLTP